MDFLAAFIDIFLHIDRHLVELTQAYPTAVYFILFLVVFCETGLVVTPFLPGDSLLFAVGALAAVGALDAGYAFVLLTIAAIAGDGVNYWIGRRLGPRVFRREDVRFLNRKHLDQTYRFYERYGQKTIVLARFVPIVRTFAPFVAGMGSMNYSRFAASNVLGALAWVGICLGGGYLWGNQPFVKRNFSLVILGIVFVSLLPAIVQIAMHKLRKPEEKKPLPTGLQAPEG
jgi:membrane-associated protein